MRSPKQIPADIEQRGQIIGGAISTFGPVALAKELGLRTTWAMYKWQKQGYVTNAYLGRFCRLTKQKPAQVCDPDISTLFNRR
jgi:hypothetical protein